MLFKGVVTRKRVTSNRTEESVIDLVLVSSELGQLTKSVQVDEEHKYALTRITKTKKGVVTKRSDHNTIITDLEVVWNKGVKQEKI